MSWAYKQLLLQQRGTEMVTFSCDSHSGDQWHELSLKPRHISEVRRVLDEFLTDYEVPDDLLIRTRREREEMTREALTLAIIGKREMTLHFSRANILSLQFTAVRNGSPLEFVRINGKDSQTAAHELNTIFTQIVNNDLPSLDKVMRALETGKSSQPGRSQQNVHLPSFLQIFPHFQVPCPTFCAECYGGGKNRSLTALFAHLTKSGQIAHRRFKIVYQWGNSIRLDFIAIRHPKEGYAGFLAVDGIITVWHTEKDISPQMA